MSKKDKPFRAAIGQLGFVCTVCRGEWFLRESVHLASNTQLFAWAQGDATGLICTQCGYLHLFYNDDLRLIPDGQG